MVTIALTCFSIYADIMAIIHCAELEKAGFLKVLGIVCLVLVFINSIVEVNVVGASALAMLPISLALIILYIVGASKNEKAFEARH